MNSQIPQGAIRVLDHGYVRLIESWGRGDARISEAGIIEAARQSTQGAFRSWEPYEACDVCGAWRQRKGDHYEVYNHDPLQGCGRQGVHTWKDYPRGDLGLLNYLFNSNPPHATLFEFAGMVIEVRLPIFVIREWHRHRTQGYNEMSARYAPLPDFNYMPGMERLFLTQQRNKQAQAVAGAEQLEEATAEEWLVQLDSFYRQAERLYQHGLSIGVPKEVARVCLPVGRYTQMRATAVLRNWLAFLTLRYHPRAQWEIQQFAEAVGQLVAQEFPHVWNLFDKVRPKE